MQHARQIYIEFTLATQRKYQDMIYRTQLADIVRDIETDHIAQPEFRAFMIETAFRYFSLGAKSSAGVISETLYALCIEIILKSFNSSVSANGGTLDERYEFTPPRKNTHGNNHDLTYLLEICPDTIQRYLCPTETEKRYIEMYRNHFSQNRYIYEATVPAGSCGILQELAATFLMKIIHLYRKKGCQDPFILCTDHDAEYEAVLSTAFLIAP